MNHAIAELEQIGKACSESSRYALTLGKQKGVMGRTRAHSGIDVSTRTRRARSFLPRVTSAICAVSALAEGSEIRRRQDPIRSSSDACPAHSGQPRKQPDRGDSLDFGIGRSIELAAEDIGVELFIVERGAGASAQWLHRAT